MASPRPGRLAILTGLLSLGIAVFADSKPPVGSHVGGADVDRSPIDLALTKDQQRLITANHTAGTVSVLDVASGKVLCEIPCGERPAALALAPDEKRLLVTATYAGEVVFFAFDGQILKEEGRVFVSFEPRGIVISPKGQKAYVALTSGHCVAEIDLASQRIVRRLECGKWPRYLALTPDEKRLAVGCSGDGGIAVLDLTDGSRLHQDDFAGLNLGMIQMDHAGRFVYFPFMVYRGNPITKRNIQIGWVLASRIGRLDVTQNARREAFSLDKQGEAVADPHGLALSPDEQRLVCAASGSQELLVFRLKGLPFEAYGSTDHIPPDLYADKDRFFRIHLGGRPMACRFAANGREVYVANYLASSVQVVDLDQRKVVRTIDVGSAPEPTLARRGEVIFYDGKRSLDQWYSCHSCHYEGHVSSVPMDTLNDGRGGNFKTVLTLRNLGQTAPYTWHGWQKKLDDALDKSMRDTMLGPPHTAEDVQALAAYLQTLRHPPNPYRSRDGRLSPAAERGQRVFASEKAGCARCHAGDYFTDGLIHEVGTGERTDVYKGYNPPSLIGVFDRIRYLHDGRARTLEELLTGPHSPAKVAKKGDLTAEELKDLIEYLKSL